MSVIKLVGNYVIPCQFIKLKLYIRVLICFIPATWGSAPRGGEGRGREWSLPGGSRGGSVLAGGAASPEGGDWGHFNV